MNLDLTALDDAVIDRIKVKVAGFRLVATLDSEDQLTQPSSDSLPAAYTLVNGATYLDEEGNSRYQEGAVTLTVFIKTRNLRALPRGAARKSDDGAYAMINKTVDALLGFAPAGCGYLNLVEISAVRVVKTDAIFAVHFMATTSEDY